MERTINVNEIRELTDDELDTVEGGHPGLLLVLISAMGVAAAWYVGPK
jgi:bacteriocin-like protein